MTLDIRKKLDKEISSVINRYKIDKRFYVSKGNLTYSYFLSNKMLVVFVIKRGVPYSLFDVIQHYTPFTENDWANLLDLSTKSLQRYKQSSKVFGPLQSEKIIEMTEVTETGLDFFGDMEKFKLWLNTPNFAFGKIKPMDLLGDSYGKEMVISQLTRLSHGIFV